MLSQIKTIFFIFSVISFTLSCQNKKTNIEGIEKKTDKVTQDIDEQKGSIEGINKDVANLGRDLKVVNSQIEEKHKEESKQIIQVNEGVVAANSKLETVTKNTQIVSERINEGAKLKYIDLLRQENTSQQKIIISKNYLSSLFLDSNDETKNLIALESFFNDVNSLLTSVKPDINENDILETLNSDIYFYNRSKVSQLDSLKAISINLAEYKLNKSDNKDSIYQSFLKFLNRLPEIESGAISMNDLNESDKLMYTNNQLIQFLMHLRLNTYLAVFLNKYTDLEDASSYSNGIKKFIKKVSLSSFLKEASSLLEDAVDLMPWTSYRTKFVNHLQNENELNNLKRNLEIIKYTFEVNKKLPINIIINKKIAKKISLVEMEVVNEKDISSSQLKELDGLKKILIEIQAEVKKQI